MFKGPTLPSDIGVNLEPSESITRATGQNLPYPLRDLDDPHHCCIGVPLTWV